MKARGFLVLGLLAALCAPVLADDAASPALKVSIAIPQIWWANNDRPVQRSLLNQQSDAHFQVVIENVSSTPVFLTNEGNSEGWGTLSFEVVLPNGKVMKIDRQMIDWSANVLTFDKLEPGDCMTREIYFATDKQYYYATKHSRPLEQEWTPNFPFPDGGHDITVTLRAIFEQKLPDGAENKWGEWIGRVVSPDYQIVLSNG